MQRRSHTLFDLIIQSLLISLTLYFVVDVMISNPVEVIDRFDPNIIRDTRAPTIVYSYERELLGAITIYPVIVLVWQIANTCITIFGYNVKHKLPWIKIGAVTILIWFAVVVISFLISVAIGTDNGQSNIFGEIISYIIPFRSWFSSIVISLFVLINWVLTIKDLLATRVRRI